MSRNQNHTSDIKLCQTFRNYTHDNFSTANYDYFEQKYRHDLAQVLHCWTGKGIFPFLVSQTLSVNSKLRVIQSILTSQSERLRLTPFCGRSRSIFKHYRQQKSYVKSLLIPRHSLGNWGHFVNWRQNPVMWPLFVGRSYCTKWFLNPLK